MTVIELLALCYFGGAMFAAGTLAAEHARWPEWWVVPAWLPVAIYAATWGLHERRRWYCAIVGHRFHPVVTSIDVAAGRAEWGEQCSRCWKISDKMEPPPPWAPGELEALNRARRTGDEAEL